MKKFTGILLSIAMIFSVGTTTVLAEPASDTSGSQDGINLLTVPDETEDTLDQQETQEEIAESENPEQEEIVEETDTEENVGEPESEEGPEDVVLEDSEEEENPDETEVMPLDSGVKVDYVDDLTLTLQYDDRYDLSKLDRSINSGEDYVIYAPEGEQEIESYQVSKGEITEEKDTALITLKEENSTEVIATGVGTGTVYLVRSNDLDDLIAELEKEEETANLDNQGEDSDDEKTDESQNADGTNEETIEAYKIKVTVEKAPLRLMFLVGQSNMEGYCDSHTGYKFNESIACQEGTVYSTYVPSSTSKGKDITGILFSNLNADNCVAGSLQGDTNISGGQLEYPLNSLTTEGSGKTGPDSGLAYEWNSLTGDKVWVVNTAYGATDIASWVPGGSCYQRSLEIWDDVLQTYEAECDEKGHYYESGQKLVFWQQGETGDATNLDASSYESQFSDMYAGMSEEIGDDALPFGIIMVRAGYAIPSTERSAGYKTDKDLKMTGPRIAQYWLGSGDSGFSNVFVVSNANEKWVSDSGVESYFQGKSYPTHNGSVSGPTKVDDVHYDIHYSQIGHNENGITAAYGMYKALYKSAPPSSVSWKDADGQTVSSTISLDYTGDETTLVAVSDPIYYAKSVTYSSGSTATYNASTGTVKGTNVGTSNISAIAGGSSVGTIKVKVNVEKDLSDKDKLGKVTGVYKYNGTWYYVVEGIIQTDYEGVKKNDNGWWYIKDGMVDFTYNGFAQNENGWWYIEDGKVTFEKNGVLKDTNKKVDGTDGWWYVVESEVQFDYTNKVANYKNSNGWWYIKNGKVDFSANTIAKNNNGWWYVTGGKVDFSYNGFGSNSNGKWYCEDGKVTFNKNSVLKDTTGAIGTKGTWYYVVGSQVQTSYNGVANYKNSNGWWYIKDGKVDFDANTVAKNNNGWWYVLGGKVQFGFTGLANYSNSNGWWYIKDGKVDFNHSGVDKNVNGWWYVSGGKVNFSFNGIAQNSNGWWYIKNGKVDFSYTGKVMVSGITYTVTDGKVAR